jgi:outer membrane lipoprotein-sorting protein
MKKRFLSSENQSGFGHIGLILAVVGVLAIGGLVAWRFLGANKAATTDSAVTSLAEKLANAKCEYDDKDLCKFFVSWKEHDSYKMVSDNTDKETGQSSRLSIEVDGEDSHSIMTGEFASEIIAIGTRTTYTKATDGTWWKKTVPESAKPEETTITESKPDFKEPETDEMTTEKTEYKALGKEACGSLTCFKYQVIDSTAADTTSYIWFDTKDYQLRRTLSDGASYKSDMTFEYDDVQINAPATFKELAENQVIIPGQSEPMTIPTAADYGIE